MRAIDSALNSGALNTELSQTQRDLLARVPDEQRPLMEAQMRMEKEQQAVNFITNILKKLSEMNMAIINNMR